MKSSTGKYYLGLDQIRGVAALLVFTWHFIHIHNGHESGPVIFPLNVFYEGHTGVALFMTLSGYLFSKLLDNKKIYYWKFIFNRLIRLLPLLLFMIILNGIITLDNWGQTIEYLKKNLTGFVLPNLPNGGWSITVEFHFYLLLPLLLLLNSKRKNILAYILAVTIFTRVLLYFNLGQIQFLSYWTIIGRIDQFILGILAFKYHRLIKGRNKLMILTSLLFLLFYFYFDSIGGFYSNHNYPSSSPIWIFMPTIEGLFYSILTAWYDNSTFPSNSLLHKIMAAAGKYSYSIYLLHFFLVFKMASFIDKYILDLSNTYIALIFSFLCFLIMIPMGHLSYNYIEKPFLKFRVKYLKE